METYPTWIRLHPDSTDETMVTSVQARIHDPLWLLGRQWQFGELRPRWRRHADRRAHRRHLVAVDATARRHRPASATGSSTIKSLQAPLETLVEREAVPETGLDNLRLRTEAGVHSRPHVARAGMDGRVRSGCESPFVRPRRTWMPRHETGSTWWTAACQMVPHSPVSSVPSWPRRAVRQSTRTKRESSARG
jgi:hypothetical protein